MDCPFNYQKVVPSFIMDTLYGKQITIYGDGLQKIIAFNKKNVVSSVEIVNPGEGYTNKTLFFEEDHVNEYDNKIEYPNHRYNNTM